MPSTLSRRRLIALAGGAVPLLAQGIATRGIKPAPRGKPSGLPFPVHLVDVAAEAGLRAPVIYGGIDRKDYILETLGCGVAFFDYDNDGWLDIFVPSGSRMDGAPAGAVNRLYKNNRDGTFTDVTEKAGLLRGGWACGVTVADYNNDGFDDLFITYWGQNVLYRNNGDGTFTDVTKEAGLLRPERHWGSGCAFVDYDRDGHLDLFFTTYVDFDPARVPRPGQSATCNWKGVPVNCGPRGLPRGRSFLYHNDGKGHFSDVSDKAGVSKARAYGLTAVAADLDDDGWPDLYIACDSTHSLFFRNRRDGTFAEEGLERGIAVNEDGMEQAGMGLAAGDFDLDGRLDIFKTHFADDTSILYRGMSNGEFEDVTLRAGIAVETRFVGWGCAFVDLDNDGLPDIFLVTGSVYPEMEARLPSHAYKTPRIVFRALGGGKFEELIDEAGPGAATPHASRGCAFGDFDNDGDVDMLIMNMNELPSLLRNDGAGKGNWVKILLEGTKSNRSAIGARVTVTDGRRRWTQVVLSQSSFCSVSDRRLHFGLGNTDSVTVEVRWPMGQREMFGPLPAGRLHLLKESAGRGG